MRRRTLFVMLAALAAGAAGAVLWFMPEPRTGVFHVDGSVRSSGSGRSWSSAWRSFADIDWAALQPGDAIHVAGGTYRETLTVGQGGAPGRPITIMAATDTGRHGTLVIDGQNTRPFGIAVHGRDHVTIRGFDIRNHADAGISVKQARAGVVIENNKVFSGDPGGGNARGYDVRDSVGEPAVVVRNNGYSTPRDSKAQTDGIWSSGNRGVVFEGNRIVISNSNTDGHSDGFQSYQDHSVIVRNNWIEQVNLAATDNHGMWISDSRSGGLIQVHDNVVLAPNLTGDSNVTHWHSPAWAERGAIQLWNNTIHGGRRALNLDNSPLADVKSNILMPSPGGTGIVVQNAALPPAAIDGNLIWAPNGTIAWVDGAARSWAEWQRLGYDARGVNADPQFVNLAARDLRLTAASPASDRGARPVTLAGGR